MGKIVVELDAYVLPDDHAIFKVSPGKTYRFYEEVRRANAIFLDIRGLDGLDGRPDQWDEKRLLDVIADDRWSRELISRQRGNEPKGSEGVTKTDRMRMGFLKALLGEAKKGDLVVVPVEGYNKDVLIGELLDERWDTRTISAQDGEDGKFNYIGRRVRWRSAQPKRHFSGEMIAGLHTQTALFRLGRSLHEEVYRLAYRNFVYKNQFVADFYTTKQHFTSEDSAVLSAWLNGFDFLRYCISAHGAPNLPASFDEMGLSKIPDQIAADLTININSPGSFVLKSTGTFALALMAILPLCACDAKRIIDDGVEIQLKTIGSADAACAIDVAEEVKTYASTLSYDRLERACELGRRAQQDAQVSTQARLK